MATSPSFSHSGRSGGETKPANVKIAVGYALQAVFRIMKRCLPSMQDIPWQDGEQVG